MVGTCVMVRQQSKTSIILVQTSVTTSHVVPTMLTWKPTTQSVGPHLTVTTIRRTSGVPMLATETLGAHMSVLTSFALSGETSTLKMSLTILPSLMSGQVCRTKWSLELAVPISISIERQLVTILQPRVHSPAISKSTSGMEHPNSLQARSSWKHYSRCCSEDKLTTSIVICPDLLKDQDVWEMENIIGS